MSKANRYTGTNSTHITISLKRAEREAICAEAERQGIAPATLCAYFVRLHIKTLYKVTPQRAAHTKKESV